MKIKGAVLYQDQLPQPYSKSQPLHVTELELDGPGPGEVLVEVKAAGMCHSDLSVINGSRPRPLPMFLGHEASGVVAEAGSSVVVFGMGGVGLSSVMGTRLSGAWPVIAVDVLEPKLQIARRVGATHCIKADEEKALEAIRDLTGGGEDYVFEAGGNVTVLAQAYAATRPGGTTVSIGLPHPQSEFSLKAVALVGEGRQLIGSYLGSSVPMRDLPRYVKLYRAGLLPIDHLVTSTLPLDQINEGFDELDSGKQARQIPQFG